MVGFERQEKSNSSFWPSVYLLAGALVIHTTSLLVRRLYFSPLAKFPGPKLAALTGWYETYFEIIKRRGGQFTFEIKRLHEQYGGSFQLQQVHASTCAQLDSCSASWLTDRSLRCRPHCTH